MICTRIARNLLTSQLRNTAIPVRLLTTAESTPSNLGTESSENNKQIDPAEFKALEERLKLAESSSAEFKDKYIRALAETENVRNRMVKVI